MNLTEPATDPLDPEVLARARTAPCEPLLGTLARDQELDGTTVAVAVTLLGALVTWAVSLPGLDVRAVTDRGLISEYGVATWIGTVGVIGAFAVAVGRRPRPGLLPLVPLVALVVVLHGTVALVSPHPRMPTAWLHVGFVEQITRTGAFLPDLDARFSWPGGFALAALITEAGGLRSALWFVRWSPLVWNLLFLLPLWSIACSVTRAERVRWAALGLFATANWVGQDYFAPQALAYFWWLVIVAVVVRWFRRHPNGDRTLGRWGRAAALLGLRSGPDPLDGRRGAECTGAQGAVVVIGLGLIAAALVISHQLTPYLLVAGLALLAVLRFTVLRTLWLLIAVAAVAWFSFGARAYWLGNLRDVVEGLGRITDTVDQSVADRVTGNPDRLFVVRTRIVFALGVWALAVAGLLRQWFRGRPAWALAVLGAAPFPVLAAQSYGGEVMLRVYLFTLPFMALLGASVLLGSERSRPRLAGVTVFVTLVALVPAFVVARYGNEGFEQISDEDVATAEWMYANLPRDAALVTLEAFNVIGFREPAWKPAVLDDPELADLGQLNELAARTPGGVYLVLLQGDLRFVQVTEGRDRDWPNRVRQRLATDPRFAAVFEAGPTSGVFRYLPTGAGA